MARRSARSRQEVASGPGRHEPDQRCNRSNAASGALAGQPSPSAQPTKARNGPSITSAMAARGCTMMPTCSRLPADCTVPPSAAPPAPRRLHAAPSRPELALGSAASPRQRLGPRRFVGLGLEGCATLDVELFTDHQPAAAHLPAAGGQRRAAHAAAGAAPPPAPRRPDHQRPRARPPRPGRAAVRDPRDRRFLTSLVYQTLLAFLGAATGIMAVVLLGTSGGPNLSPTVSLFHLLGYNCWWSAPCSSSGSWS